MGMEEVQANKALEQQRHERGGWGALPAAVAAGAVLLTAHVIDNGPKDQAPAHNQPTQVEHTTEAPIAEFPGTESPHQSVEDLPPAVSSPTDIPPLPR